MKLITLHYKRTGNSGDSFLDEKLINPEQISSIEVAHFTSANNSTVHMTNGSTYTVIESMKQILELIDGKKLLTDES